MKGRPAIGTYTGTGSAINLVLGFVPDFLLISNETDGDYIMTWGPTLAAGTSVDIAAAVVANAANGITALDSETLGRGVTIGTDGSESAKVYRYIAFSAEA